MQFVVDSLDVSRTFAEWPELNTIKHQYTMSLAAKVIPIGIRQPISVVTDAYSQQLLRDCDPYDPNIPEWLHHYRMKNNANVQRGIHKLQVAEANKMLTLVGSLRVKRLVASTNEILDYGLVSTRVVTTAGVNFIVDAFQNTASLPSMKYHGIGTGDAGAEDASDTVLETELTTQYSSANTRATGTTTEGATANIYRTVGTITVSSGPLAIVEHGVFSQAATGGGTLFDRSVFADITLQNGDSLQCTYELTIPSGS